MAFLETLDRVNAPSGVNRRRLNGSVTHQLAVLIIGGKLQPGEILPNVDTLSAALYVSRTAYREGIRTLVAKGLVSARPKVGTMVNPRSSWNLLDADVLSWYFEVAPDPSFITSLFELRRIVEPSAAALAAERHTAQDAEVLKRSLEGMRDKEESPVTSLEADLTFHHTILAASQNETLLALSSAIESTLRWSVRLKMTAKPKIYEDSFHEHERVLDAILNREADVASTRLRTLVDKALAETLEALQNQRHQT